MEDPACREQRQDVESGLSTPPEANSAAPTIVPDLQLEGKLEPPPTGQMVRFCCHVSSAQSVSLVGTFNDWDPRITPMARDEDGAWSVNIELDPGRHEYDFVVDGRPCRKTAPDDPYQSIPDCVSKGNHLLNRAIEIV